ncbi:ammonia-forming cytochrome c nitrite reductase subunit c552 [Candidatus Sumerlaeota bacterium]|nr:ammonia-forming cytochrome c nitrite reductase subunit c552 [Candidatus Sumerlaeota bacterium]
MSETNSSPKKAAGMLKIIVLTTIISAAAAFGATALLIDIFEKKQEARQPFFRVVELDDDTEDPEIWGKNFPQQYDGYKRTVDQQRTRYGGSEALPRTPDNADPRSIVSQSKIEEDNRLKRMWAGYAFAIDFREERGHAYMLDDQTYTSRQTKPQPGTCLNCHASMYVAYKKAGDGDIFAGFTKINQMPYMEARKLVKHPVACIDCHDPATMQLRVTRPAFIEAIAVVKKNTEGIDDYDVNATATRQELRAYVCGQCHAEYYFKGEEKRLTYPWSKGLQADQILAYYDEYGFKDWTHADTGAAALKTQHPEFELWSQGVHARSGVACADCHMPYMRVGAQKISDHHVRSPMLNAANACQTCHRIPEAEIMARVDRIQRTHFEIRNLAMDALMELIDDIKAAMAAGATDDALAAPRDYQRKAQFLIDFAEAENSTGFHAPQEGARVLATAIDLIRKGQAALNEPAVEHDVAMAGSNE